MWPHAPQLFLSIFRFVQVPLQSVNPTWHWQAPDTQVDEVAEQAAPPPHEQAPFKQESPVGEQAGAAPLRIGVPTQEPFIHLSSVVQGLPSSQGVPSGFPVHPSQVTNIVPRFVVNLLCT